MTPARGPGDTGAGTIVVMGRVSGAYGVHGMIKLQPLSEDPRTLLDHATWWLRPRDGGAWSERDVVNVRPQGAALVATLRGLANREEAAALRGASIGIPRDALPDLAADELYYADLEGLAVINREGVALGTVAEVMDNGAHAILRVRDAGAVERLIPWVERYVDRVDTAARRIDVDWPADF